MGIKHLTSILVQSKKNCFLQNFAANIFFFAFFKLLSKKMLKLTISTIVWCALHPNAGRNIQQICIWSNSFKLELLLFSGIFAKPQPSEAHCRSSFRKQGIQMSIMSERILSKTRAESSHSIITRRKDL